MREYRVRCLFVYFLWSWKEHWKDISSARTWLWVILWSSNVLGKLMEQSNHPVFPRQKTKTGPKLGRKFRGFSEFHSGGLAILLTSRIVIIPSNNVVECCKFSFPVTYAAWKIITMTWTKSLSFHILVLSSLLPNGCTKWTQIETKVQSSSFSLAHQF